MRGPGGEETQGGGYAESHAESLWTVAATVWKRAPKPLKLRTSFEDLVQEAFAKASELAGCDARALGEGYLVSSVRRHLLTTLRREGVVRLPYWACRKGGREENPDLFDTATKMLGVRQMPERRPEAVRRRRLDLERVWGLLLKALDGMEAEPRDLLCRLWGVGREKAETSAEVAGELGITRQAVDYREKKALGALRARLGPMIDDLVFIPW